MIESSRRLRISFPVARTTTTRSRAKASTHRARHRGGPRKRAADAIRILTPVFEDWESCDQMLERLDAVLAEADLEVSVSIVDDGSLTATPADFGRAKRFRAIAGMNIIRLVTNVGHQRAIAIGLAQVVSEPFDGPVVVMDGDGEDRPEDVPRLIECARANPDRAVVAERTVRKESKLFRVFYALYKRLFAMLTGQSITFGNFCLLPANILTRLINSPDLWIHVPAAILRNRIPIEKVPTVRGIRLHGRSRMPFSSLVRHGFGAIAVFADTVLARLLTLCGVIAASGVAGIIVVAAIRFLTDLAIPGWASTVTGVLTIIVIQVTLAVLLMLFMVIRNVANVPFVPRHHAEDYVAEVERR